MNSASSKSNKGPVVPTISNGCPENREKMTPDTDVATKVSDIPMKFLVLSAENYVKTMVCLKTRVNFLLNGWISMSLLIYNYGGVILTHETTKCDRC